MSESLYRKYRPQVFTDVVGQDHIIKTLQNSISANKVSHAYLFCGPRGTGKTTTARILAKALLCENGPTVSPDGTCEDCQMIARSVHPDVSELDAASRTGVENVRDEIISRVGYAPVRGNYKVYVIDEVHMLSNAAFNALLKTLEEPPSHIVFVLCTTDPQKVPETIRSRCQRFDFRPINAKELTGRLGAVCEMENVPFEGEALELIAQRSNGGLRDALTALEQTIAFGDNKVSLSVVQDMFGKTDVNDLNDLVLAIAEKNVNKCLEFIETKVNDGVDFAQFVDDFAQRMRDVYVVKLSSCDIAVSPSEANVEQIKEEAKRFDEARLSYILSLMHDLSVDLKTASNQRLSFELGIFKMLYEHCSMTFEAIDARLSALENGAPVAETGQVNAVENKSPAPSPDHSISDNSLKPKTYNLKPSVGIREQGLGISEKQGMRDQGLGISEKSATEAPPRTVPAPPFPTTNGRIDFRSIWKNALDDLKSGNPAIYSLLDSAHGSFNQPSKTITLKMEAGRSFAYNNLNKPASKTAIIDALEKAGLSGATVKVVMLEEESLGTRDQGSESLGIREQGLGSLGTRDQGLGISSDSQGTSPTNPYSLTPNTSETDGHPEPSPSTEAADSDTEPPTPNPYSLVPNPSNEAVEEEAAAIEKSEIDEFNDILASTFGEGASFKEVK